MTKHEPSPKKAKAKAPDPIETLVALLADPRPERRSAAAIVLAELAPESDEVLEALRAAVRRDDDAPLRRFGAEAIGAIAPRSIVTDLQHLLKDPEKVVRETASKVLASGRGVKAADLQKMLDGSDEKDRLAAIVVLGAMGGREAQKRLLAQLPKANARVVAGVLDAVRPLVAGAAGDDAHHAVEDLTALLGKDTLVSDAALSLSVVDLLGSVQGDAAVDPLLEVITSRASAEVRSHALEAIRRVLRGKKADPKIFKVLLECLENTGEHATVVHAAVEGLLGLEVPLVLEPRVRALVASESAAAKRWAIKALGELDTAPAGKTLAKVVETADFADRELALEAARRTASGRQELARLLGRTADVARARAISVALRTSGEELEPGTRQLLEDAVVEATPESAEIIIELLKHVGGKSAGKVQDSLLEKAVRLKKKAQYGDAIAIFRSICHGPQADPEARFQLGVCELKTSKKTISRGAMNDPALLTFQALAKVRDFPLVDRLKKEKVLEPEELYFLGFSFAESQGAEQSVGGDILTHVAEVAAETKLGRMAKNKLVTMGWEE